MRSAAVASMIVLWSAAARADDAAAGVVLGTFVGPAYVPASVAFPVETLPERRVGLGAALSVAYQPRYFLHPFVDVAHFDLGQATALAAVSPPVFVSQSLGGTFVQGGVGVDLGPVTLRGGVGVGVLQRRSVVLGVGAPPNELTDAGLTSALSVAVRVVRRRAFSLALEGRAVALPSTPEAFFAVGLALRLGPLGS